MTGHYICQLKIQKNFVYNPQSKSPYIWPIFFLFIVYLLLLLHVTCTYLLHDTILTI